MLEVLMMIERPLDVVWEYFIQPANWEEWYGGRVKAVIPGWINGAELHWELGGSSMIGECQPREKVTICGSWMDTSYQFEPQGEHSTIVRIIQTDPKGGAAFTDGGRAQRTELETCLQRLKQSIEEGSSDMSQVENERLSKAFDQNSPDDIRSDKVAAFKEDINSDAESVDETERYFDRLTIRGKWWLQRLWGGKYISSKRLSKAVQYYASMGASEKPIFLFSNTHWRSPKYGFLITDRQMYYHVDMENSWKKVAGSIPLDGRHAVRFIMRKIEGLNLEIPCMCIDGEIIGTCSYLNASEMDVLNDFFQRRARPAVDCSERPNWLAEGERILHVLNRNIHGLGWTATKVYITNMRIFAVPSGVLTVRPATTDSLDLYYKSFALMDIKTVSISPPLFHKDFINTSKLTMEMSNGQKVACDGPMVNLVEMADWIEMAKEEQEPLLQFEDSEETILYNDGGNYAYDIFDKFYRTVSHLPKEVKFTSRMCITNKRIIYYRIENFGGRDHKQHEYSSWSYWYRTPRLSWIEISFENVVALKIEKGHILPGDVARLELKGITCTGFVKERTAFPPMGTGNACFWGERMQPTETKVISFSDLSFASKKSFNIVIEALRQAIPDRIQSLPH